MGVKKPIILIGTGRCGSTIIHNALTRHKDAAYLDYRSMLTEYSPRFHRAIMNMQDLPFIGDVIRDKNYACEDYRLWNKFYRGFGDTYRDLEDYDVTNKAKKGMVNFCSSMLTKSRQTMVIKITGWGRIGFLKEIFPDAKFVHIIRDGRGNTNSLTEVDFWKGWKGTAGWGIGNLSDRDREIWNQKDNSYIVLAGLYWKIINQKIDESIEKYSPDVMKVKYEEFCSNPMKELQDICSFTGLPVTKHFEKNINGLKIKSMNHKWKENFTDKQAEDLDSVIHVLQEKYGYE